jgi:hypothetical protein
VVSIEALIHKYERACLHPELAEGGNEAIASDDFVVQPPEATVTMRLSNSGIVCCGSKRRYIGKAPTMGTSAPINFLVLSQSSSPQISQSPNSSATIKPGNYSLFVRTRRVMRGWPKSERDTYHSTSNLVVTSSTILHVTILPDAARDKATSCHKDNRPYHEHREGT